jgi:hypothetical protein
MIIITVSYLYYAEKTFVGILNINLYCLNTKFKLIFII